MRAAKTVHVSLGEELALALRRKAQIEDRPVSRIVRRALERYLADSERNECGGRVSP